MKRWPKRFPKPRRRGLVIGFSVFSVGASLAVVQGVLSAQNPTIQAAQAGAITNHGFSDSRIFAPAAGRARTSRSDLLLSASDEPSWSEARLAFSGRSLMYECGGTDRGFLGDVWSQSALLAAFSGGSSFFSQAVRSAQETDAFGAYRPSPGQGAVLPSLENRLGVGGRIDSPTAQGKVWLLNHVRLRPDQIKLNYELLVFEAGVDPTIEYAAFIHSVLIPPALQPAYQNAVMTLESSEERARRTSTGPDDVGCALRSFLDTWIPQGRYFFLHANVFDRSRGGDAGEWVFAEFKPARFQSLAGPDRPQPLVFESIPTGGVSGVTLELRIVPMAFQRFRKQGIHLVPIADDRVTIWKSSSIDDQFIDLVLDDQGLPVPRNDLVFNNPQAYTCVQCHDAAFGVVLTDEETSLPPVQRNHFRHIAWGLVQPFGLPRWGGARPSQWYERFLQQRTEVEAGRIVNP